MRLERPPPSARNRPRRSPQRGPARRRRGAEELRRAYAPPHFRRGRQHETPEREREADRRGTVQASSAHFARNNDAHGAARDAAVATRGEEKRRRRPARMSRMENVASAGAMAVRLNRFFIKRWGVGLILTFIAGLFDPADRGTEQHCGS